MTKLTKDGFKNKWEGLFPDNTSKEIDPERMREYKEDTADSFLTETNDKIANPGGSGVWNFASGLHINMTELSSDTVITTITGLPLTGIGVATVTVPNTGNYNLNVDPSALTANDFDAANFDSARDFSTVMILYNDGNINIQYSPNTGTISGGVQAPGALAVISDPPSLTATEI